MASWALTVGHWRRVPIRLHASVPLGLYVLSGFQFNPLWWLCTLVLILLHEQSSSVDCSRVSRQWACSARPSPRCWLGFRRRRGRC